MESEQQRVIVVSNRLPVVLAKNAGQWKARPGTGGLVTALQPVLRQRAGVWVGWPGVSGEASSDLRRCLSNAGAAMGIQLEPVPLTSREIGGFYRGFSNEILWPLFHDLLMRCNFDSAYWTHYLDVNRKFSRAVARTAKKDDFVWVQDYHFLQAGEELRRLGVKNGLGLFLHTPFPAPDMFLRLPWRAQILEGLLAYDLVGFQSARDRKNFLECTSALAEADVADGSAPVATLSVGHVRGGTAAQGPRRLRVGTFPIGIDFESFETLARSKTVRATATRLAQELGPVKLLLGVDRLDYTKGLPQKIRGFRRALERHPELLERVTLVQHVVPSRESVPQYKRLRLQVERLVSEVNGKLGTPGWTPVRYFYKELSRPRLSAFYRLSDVLLVTSLKDGMNLVSKEFCASRTNEDGVLVLSEFAGANAELRTGCLSVNPYDVDGLAEAIFTAATMPNGERRRRMAQLRRTIEKNDVFQWGQTFLHNASASSSSAGRPRGSEELPTVTGAGAVAGASASVPRPTSASVDIPAPI